MILELLLEFRSLTFHLHATPDVLRYDPHSVIDLSLLGCLRKLKNERNNNERHSAMETMRQVVNSQQNQSGTSHLLIARIHLHVLTGDWFVSSGSLGCFRFELPSLSDEV